MIENPVNAENYNEAGGQDNHHGSSTSASDYEYTREEAILKINQADTISEVFDIANKAFEDRVALWGDDLLFSIAAYSKWCAIHFPVAAIDQGANILKAKPLPLIMPVDSFVTIPKEEFLKTSVDTAKKVAINLLTQPPQPPEIKSKAELIEYHEKISDLWKDVSSTSVKILKNSFEKSISSHYIIYDFEFDVSPKIELEAALQKWSWLNNNGKDWGYLCDRFANPKNVDFLGNRDRGDDAFKAKMDKQWLDADAHESNFSELLKNSGASFISVSPAGGIKSSLKGAGILCKSFQDLAKHVGVADPRFLSVGLEGLFIGLVGKSYYAHCTQNFKTLSVMANPAFVGHEWTHLLDYAISKKGDAVQKNAIKDLISTIHEIPGDKKLKWSNRASMNKYLREELGLFLMHYDFYNERGFYVGKIEEKQKDIVPCTQEFLDNAIKASRSGKSSFIKFLKNSISSTSAPPRGIIFDMACASFSVITAYDKLMTSTLKSSIGVTDKVGERCSFLETALIEDAKGYAKKGYFQSEAELLARVSEAFFASKNSITSVSEYCPVASVLLPSGEEAEILNEKYQELLDAFKANPEPLLSERVKNQLISEGLLLSNNTNYSSGYAAEQKESYLELSIPSFKDKIAAKSAESDKTPLIDRPKTTI